MAYNLFDKPPGTTLDRADLQKLIDHRVAEGYYVEYKSDFPTRPKIGHSIASFANTYGGWYFVGIKTDENNVANEICGFAVAAHHDPIARIREIVKYHIDPVPIFYPQVVPLDTERAVLVVYVPENQQTPFISQDGRIYRRTYDSSDPVRETNRYSIDRLVDNGRDVAKRFEKFCQDERTFAEAERKQGWVKLFLAPYPLGLGARPDRLSGESIEKLMGRSRAPVKIPLPHHTALWIGANVPFNVGQPTHDSVVLRQVDPVKAAFNSLMAELFLDGRAKFFIPLHYFADWQIPDLDRLQSPRVRETLGSLWEADRQSDTLHLLRFFDIGELWLVVAHLLSYYQEWLGAESYLTELQIAAVIEGVWRSVPFFDSDDWGAHVQKFGLPITSRTVIKIPPEIGDGIRVPANSEHPVWLDLCGDLSLAFGLPLQLYRELLFQAVDHGMQRHPG